MKNVETFPAFHLVEFCLGIWDKKFYLVIFAALGIGPMALHMVGHVLYH